MQMKTKRVWKISLWIAAIIIALTAVGMYVFSIIFINSTFSHRVVKNEFTPEEFGLSADTISLTSSDGIDLMGWWIPVDEPQGIVIVLHGMDGLDASSLLPQAVFLNDSGYSVFVLDMRAHGRSGGERIGLAFEEPRDVIPVLDWINAQSNLKDTPVTLLGLSMGGAVAIRTAAARPDVDAVISVSAYASIDKMISQGMRLMDFPEALIQFFVPFSKLGMLTVCGVWPASASPLADIPKIEEQPVLIMHGDQDQQISVDNAYLLKEAAGDNVTIVIIEGADHLIFTQNGNGDNIEDQDYRENILKFLSNVP
ncbi:MAG TPA: alpha/beta fold hydrolase [Anaerolineaceae bacterium]|nr:alpha/beta fold hydrolase [Anaerolineaceae bacterium]